MTYHGPKEDMQADLMELIDRSDEERERFARKQNFVQANRIDGIRRARERHVEQEQPAHVTPRAQNEAVSVNSWSDIRSLPPHATRKTITPRVLRGDKGGMRAAAITVRERQAIQAYLLEHRTAVREGLQEDLKKQSEAIDDLEERSGQLPRLLLNNATTPITSPRLDEMAKPKEQYVPSDWRTYREFRSLLHSDYADVLETLKNPKSAPLHATQQVTPTWMGTEQPAKITAVNYRRVVPVTAIPPPPPPPKEPWCTPRGQASIELGFRQRPQGMKDVCDDVERFEANMIGLGPLVDRNFFVPLPEGSTERKASQVAEDDPVPPTQNSISTRMGPSLIDALAPRREWAITAQ
jgi:hypothetical protein